MSNLFKEVVNEGLQTAYDRGYEDAVAGRKRRAVSQQSNPATLREHSPSENEWRQLPKDHWFYLYSGSCTQPHSVMRRTDGGCTAVCSSPWTYPGVDAEMRSIADRHNAALAASGTEAAPGDVSERTLPGTCNYPFVAAGSKELGIELMITDRCELLHGHAGRHKNGNASWGQPAQADDWIKAYVKKNRHPFFGDNVEAKLLKYLGEFVENLPEDCRAFVTHALALRQSAAPSGGAALWNAAKERERLALQIAEDLMAQNMLDVPCVNAFHLINARLLAQESKTGAVTETK